MSGSWWVGPTTLVRRLSVVISARVRRLGLKRIRWQANPVASTFVVVFTFRLPASFAITIHGNFLSYSSCPCISESHHLQSRADPSGDLLPFVTLVKTAYAAYAMHSEWRCCLVGADGQPFRTLMHCRSQSWPLRCSLLEQLTKNHAR